MQDRNYYDSDSEGDEERERERDYAGDDTDTDSDAGGPSNRRYESDDVSGLQAYALCDWIVAPHRNRFIDS